MSTAGNFRKLTPLVLMRAPHNAGTDVREPVEELETEIPEDTFGAVCGALLNARATIRNVSREKSSQNIICEIPTAELRTVEQSLPDLTHGGGGWTSRFAGYAPVTGEAQARARTGPNPFNRNRYLVEVARS
jgi:ribosomal protection tetracycline resistance protein